MSRRPSGHHVLALVALLLSVGATTLPSGASPVQAASALDSTVVSTFDSSDWVVDGGAATLSVVATPATAGSGALRIAYDVRPGETLIGSRRTPPVIAGAPRSLALDVYGDASWNVVHVLVIDATGELFRYWAGSIGYSGWTTVSVGLQNGSPNLVATNGGDADGVLDLPVSVFGLNVSPGPGEHATQSSVVFDNLVATGAPSPIVTASDRAFAASAGQTTSIRASMPDADSATLTLRDSGSRHRSWPLEVAGANAAIDTPWDGSDGSGTLLRGTVTARLTAARGDRTYTYEVPYVTGVAGRSREPLATSIPGTNTFLSSQTSVARAEYLATLAEFTGVQVLREAFDWHRIETRKGYFRWMDFDRAVGVAGAHNLEVLGRLQYSAGWASSAPSSVTGSARYYYPPSDVQDFADYAAAVVRRYKDRVHYWEIWNEPNQAVYWRSGPSARQYAALLKATYAAIKAEDPSATVLLGGLATGPDSAFLDGIAAEGAWSSFDVLAIHAFVTGDPMSPTSMFPTWIDQAKATVASRGQKPIWITEWGWSTYTGGVSEARQSAFLVRGFRVAASKGVAGIIPYELEDYGTSTTAEIARYGTVARDGRRKASYTGLKCAAEALVVGQLPVCGLDLTPPAIISRSPAADSTGVARDIRPTVTFSEDVVGVKSTTVRLRDVEAGAWVSATITYDRTTHRARLTPASLLVPGRSYRMYVTDAITDVVGQRVATTSWGFLASTDASRPRVAARSPGASTTGVVRTANVVVTFNQPLRVSTVTASSIRLKDISTGRYIAAIVTYDPATRRATLNPKTTLGSRHRFTVFVSSAVKDPAGNRAVATSWSFTTRR